MGKTTCAAAAALAGAESGRRILAVSTDPAPSLGDALRAHLQAEPTRIATRRGSLLAAELAAGRALARWRAQNRQALGQIATRGSYLDDEDVEAFLALALPGADELIAWLEVARLASETGCDELVVDAAPTAHTLRLLAMPQALRRLAAALDRMQERHRVMAERFGGGWRPDESDALIASLEEHGRAIEERLQDALFWVTLPEALAVAETRHALRDLAAAGLSVREILVNRVLPPGAETCPRCGERRRAEAAAIQEIRASFSDHPIRYLPQEPVEPRGRQALRRVAKWMETPDHGLELTAAPAPDRRPLAPSPARRRGATALAWLDGLVPPGLRLLFFGGKGGVGKTTCAAAVALLLAERRPAARLLLLSTDPAHSVADVLRVPLGDDERSVPGAAPGLRARELAAERAFADWRDRHRQEVHHTAQVFTTGEGGVSDLLKLTPPGLDELIALATLLDAVDDGGGSKPYDLLVVDTAPTGHALRLLEMPELALSWDHYLLSLLLKYRQAVGLNDLAAELVALSRRLKRLQALLRDPVRARFVAVTRAGELPRRETLRLLRALRRLGMAVPAVVLNATPVGGCGRCRESTRELRFGRCAIIKAPAEIPPPRGVRRLVEWARSWQEATE